MWGTETKLGGVDGRGIEANPSSMTNPLASRETSDTLYKMSRQMVPTHLAWKRLRRDAYTGSRKTHPRPDGTRKQFPMLHGLGGTVVPLVGCPKHV